MHERLTRRTSALNGPHNDRSDDAERRPAALEPAQSGATKSRSGHDYGQIAVLEPEQESDERAAEPPERAGDTAPARTSQHGAAHELARPGGVGASSDGVRHSDGGAAPGHGVASHSLSLVPRSGEQRLARTLGYGVARIGVQPAKMPATGVVEAPADDAHAAESKDAPEQERPADDAPVASVRLGWATPRLQRSLVQRDDGTPPQEGDATQAGGSADQVDQAGQLDQGTAQSGSTTIQAPTNQAVTVHGATLVDAEKNLPSNTGSDEDASVEFNVNVATSGSPTIKTAQVTVTQTLTMPSWAERGQQCNDVQQAWDKFIGALQAHEAGHVAIDNAQFPNAHVRYVGKQTSQTQAVTDKLTADVLKVQNAYDAKNDHGRKGNPPTILDTSVTCPTPVPGPKGPGGPGPGAQSADAGASRPASDASASQGAVHDGDASAGPDSSTNGPVIQARRAPSGASWTAASLFVQRATEPLPAPAAPSFEERDDRKRPGQLTIDLPSTSESPAGQGGGAGAFSPPGHLATDVPGRVGPLAPGQDPTLAPAHDQTVASGASPQLVGQPTGGAVDPHGGGDAGGNAPAGVSSAGAPGGAGGAGGPGLALEEHGASAAVEAGPHVAAVETGGAIEGGGSGPAVEGVHGAEGHGATALEVAHTGGSSQSEGAGGGVAAEAGAAEAPGGGHGAALAGGEAIQAPPMPELAMPETGHAEALGATAAAIHGAADQVNTPEPPSGGVLDAILAQGRALFQSITSRVASAIRSAAGSVVQTISGTVEHVFAGVRSVASGLYSRVTGGVHAALNGLTGALNGIRQAASNVVHGVLSRVSSIMGTIRGALRTAVMAAINHGGDIPGAILGAVRGAISGVVSSITGLVNGLIGGISRALDAAVSGLSSLIEQGAGAITGAMETAYNAVSGILDRVQGLINTPVQAAQEQSGGIGGAIRAAISGLINRFLAVVRRVANGILSAVRSALESVRNLVRRLVDGVKHALQGALRWARDTVKSIATTVKNMIQRALSAGLALGRSMIASAGNFIRRTFQAIAKPIADLLARKAAEYLAPMIKQALAQGVKAKAEAQALGPRAAGFAQAAAREAARVAQVEAHDILRGVLKPDGDHFGVGISGTLAAEYGIGMGVTGGVMIDAVIDYVSHEIGLFFSPSVQVQAYGGLQVEGVGSVDANAAWGSVMSFGANRGRGVEAGFKGAFFNVGVSGNAAAGLEGTVGQNFYVGGKSVFGSPGSPGTTTPGTTTPGTTTPGTTTPGTTTPGTSTPGTPAQSHVVASRAALFDTQKSDITGATRSMIGDVVGTIGSQRASNPNATFQISVVGEASRRWRHPGRSTADQLNEDLSRQRAAAVARELEAQLAQRGLTPACTVNVSAIGSSAAAAQNLPPDDNGQEFREALVVVTEQEPATPGTTTPGTTTPGSTTPGTSTPGTTTPGTTTPPAAPGPDWIPPYVPDLGNRPTIGWDSTASVGVAGSVGAKVAVGVGNSYSIPLGSAAFPASAELPLRIVSSVIKLSADLGSLNIPGMVRDVIAGIGAFIPDAIIDKIVDFVIPLPPGTK